MSTLNLTRKFRIHTFEEIVGQQLVIRTLKNSLYSERLFPVYLFFGQHGCGKTSIARIFAMAINCKSLVLFRTMPKKQVVPCLNCDSCLAMLKNNNPDFIEIDAASYTGVDNIRAIIESASYLPVIGSKKIYLIDEAHMLSKASFNALLKILEEPPTNALFMLATTDVEKIIDTVRSRCFQLFLLPISTEDIYNHLTIVTQSEGIAYDTEALWAVAEQANGSVRDALNLVERIRCAYPKISISALYTVLGKISDQMMQEFFIALYEQNKEATIRLLSSESFYNATPTLLWRQIFQFLRALWYAKQGIIIDKGIDNLIIEKLKHICSVDFLGYVTTLLYTHEMHFLKTHTPRFFIEHLFISIAMRNSLINNDQKSMPNEKEKNVSIPPTKESIPIEEATEKNTIDNNPCSELSKLFLTEIKKIVTPMIYSLFEKAHFIIKQEVVTIVFPQSLIILQELLKESESTWLIVFKTIFGTTTNHTYQFTDQINILNTQNTDGNSTTKVLLTNQNNDLNIHVPTNIQRKNAVNDFSSVHKNNKTTDFSDAAQWPQVNLILKYFPGTITFIE